MRMILAISFETLVVFTLIFSAMTLIILQVMHSSLYTSVDEKLHALSSNPQAVIQLP